MWTQTPKNDRNKKKEEEALNVCISLYICSSYASLHRTFIFIGYIL